MVDTGGCHDPDPRYRGHGTYTLALVKPASTVPVRHASVRGPAVRATADDKDRPGRRTSGQRRPSRRLSATRQTTPDTPLEQRVRAADNRNYVIKRDCSYRLLASPAPASPWRRAGRDTLVRGRVPVGRPGL